RAIMAAREAAPFTSIWDFCERVDASVLNKGMLESLICGGALHSPGATRRGMLEVMDAADASGTKQQADTLMGHMSIFDLGGDGDGNGDAQLVRKHPPVPPGACGRGAVLA